MAERYGGILNLRHGFSARLVGSLIEMLLSRNEAATLGNIADGGRIGISMSSQAGQHVISVLDYLLILSSILVTLADVFKSEDSLLILARISIGLLLGMSDEYRGCLGQYGGVYYDLEVINVDQILHDDFAMVCDILRLLLRIRRIGIVDGSVSLSQELLSAEAGLLQVHKELILKDHRVVHVSIVVKVQIVIKDLLDFKGEET